MPLLCRRMLTRSLLSTAVLLLTAFPLRGEEQEQPQSSRFQYAPGHMELSISAGTLGPLFFLDPFPEGSETVVNATNLLWGLQGSLELNYYVISRLFLGAEVMVSGNAGPATDWLFLVPLLFKVGTTIHIDKRFSFPLSLGVGGSFSAYRELFHFDLAIKPAVGFRFTNQEAWGVELNLSYLMIPQFFKNSRYSRIANFLGISLALVVHNTGRSAR